MSALASPGAGVDDAPLLRLANVESAYGPFRAIRGVSLAVRPGRIVMEDTCARLREKEDIREFYLGLKEAGARGTRRWKKRKTWR